MRRRARGDVQRVGVLARLEDKGRLALIDRCRARSVGVIILCGRGDLEGVLNRSLVGVIDPHKHHGARPDLGAQKPDKPTIIFHPVRGTARQELDLGG